MERASRSRLSAIQAGIPGEYPGAAELSSIFAESCAEIESAYIRLGHRIGWRFLNSPQRTLDASTTIALITLNPGGKVERPDHGRKSSEKGSAFVVESWRHGSAPGEAPLQREDGRHPRVV